MSEPAKTPPDWALTYVRGAVQLGKSVPEIEQYLVSRGLSTEAANRLTMDIVEARFKATSPPAAPGEWGRPVRLLLGTALGGASLLLAYWYGGGYSVRFACLWVLPALLSIWYPELTDTTESDWAVRATVTGWFVLLLYLAFRIFVLVMWPTPTSV